MSYSRPREFKHTVISFPPRKLLSTYYMPGTVLPLEIGKFLALMEFLDFFRRKYLFYTALHHHKKAHRLNKDFAVHIVTKVYFPEHVKNFNKSIREAKQLLKNG